MERFFLRFVKAVLHLIRRISKVSVVFLLILGFFEFLILLRFKEKRLSGNHISSMHQLPTIPSNLLNQFPIEPGPCKAFLRLSKDSVRYRNGHWQVQEDREDQEVLVYSAFYDDRTLTRKDATQIRILGVRRVIKNEKLERILYCFIWYPDSEMPYVTKATIHVTGRDYGFKHGRLTYGQRMFSCALPNSTDIQQLLPSLSTSSNFERLPAFISLSTQECPEEFTIRLPVVRSVPPSNGPSGSFEHQFGICVGISFGNIPPNELVEWFEANMLLGVTEFNIYDGGFNSTSVLHQVLDYYSRRRGVLNIRSMPPSVDDFTEYGIRLSSPASFNDCMMRNMYRYRYIVLLDFDELIVPRIHKNYNDLLSYLIESSKSSEPHHTYRFSMAYFFLEFLQDKSQPPHLKTLIYRQRTLPGGPTYAPKSFVDPRRCLSVFNHYCWIRFKDTGSVAVDVNASIALTHHYRKRCHFEKKKCLAYDDEKRLDDSMLKFRDDLDRRVSLALKEITGR